MIVVFWLNNRSIRIHCPFSVRTRVSPVTQGLLPLILPSSGQVCHSLIVVSYCTPGSAEAQAQYPISLQSFSAGMVRSTVPEILVFNSQLRPFSSASKKALGMRTELLLFCPATVR